MHTNITNIFNLLFNSILNVLKHRWRMCYVTPWWVQGPSYFWIVPWLVLQLSLGIFLRSDTNWGDVRKKLLLEFTCTRTHLRQHRIYVSPLHNLVCAWVCVCVTLSLFGCFMTLERSAWNWNCQSPDADWRARHSEERRHDRCSQV